MAYEFRKYLTTVKELAKEIIFVCDAYKCREINDNTLSEVIIYYANEFPSKLFNGKVLNPTVNHIIGSRRTVLIENIITLHNQKNNIVT